VLFGRASRTRTNNETILHQLSPMSMEFIYKHPHMPALIRRRSAANAIISLDVVPLVSKKESSSMKKLRTLTIGFAWTSLATICLAQTVTNPVRYPNELPGYRLYAEGNWKSLMPYVSTSEDVRKWMGNPSPVYISYGADWQVIVFYFDSAIVDGRPYTTSLKGTISSINFRPRTRISFTGVEFPKAFKCIDEFRSDSPVGSYKRWSDGSGLSYVIYNESTADGRIHQGDLAEIEYAAPDGVVKKVQQSD
jgi:hypothetical protein